MPKTAAMKKSEATKNRHRNAIAHFQKWRKEHPKAGIKKQVEMFDFLVDTANSLSEEDLAA